MNVRIKITLIAEEKTNVFFADKVIVTPDNAIHLDDTVVIDFDPNTQIDFELLTV